MKLFVGLGNPGSKYERTRHNAGFMVIDQLSKAWNIELSEEKKFKGQIGRGVVKGEKVILLKPTTFMNLSGESIPTRIRLNSCVLTCAINEGKSKYFIKWGYNIFLCTIVSNDV